MSNKNDFKPFGTAANANVLAQADYEKLAALESGFTAGVAKSIELNKVWRQSSVIAASVAQFMSDTLNADVLDNGDIKNLTGQFSTAIQQAVPVPPDASSTTKGLVKLSDDYTNQDAASAATPQAVKSVFEYLPTTATVLEDVGVGRHVLPSTLTGTPQDGKTWYSDATAVGINDGTDPTKTAGINTLFSLDNNQAMELISTYNISAAPAKDQIISRMLANHYDMPYLGIKPNDLISQNNIGFYYCGATTDALVADGYPIQLAGCLEVLPSAFQVMQRYTTWDIGAIFQRNLQGDGKTWGIWRKVGGGTISLWDGSQDVSSTPLNLQDAPYEYSFIIVDAQQSGSTAATVYPIHHTLLSTGPVTIPYIGRAAGDNTLYGNFYIRRANGVLNIYSGSPMTLTNVHII